ncbi:LOW QUALITY PROTEIN: mitogen-activated protein kinase kinase kinase 3 [Wolffia australiana]
MPAWWRGKLKSKGTEEKEVKEKIKARSFDEAAAKQASSRIRDRSLFAFNSDCERRCHALPQPLISLSPPQAQIPAAASGSASVSTSSISSSGTDEPADVGFCLFSEPVCIPKNRTSEQDKNADLPVSPSGQFQLQSPFSSSNSRTSAEAASNVRARSPTHGSRKSNFSSSPRHSSVFSMNPSSPSGSIDDWKNSHPLPLPPGSPPSSIPRFLGQKWKKGRLLGKGTFGHVFLGFNSESGQMCAIKEVKVIADDKDSKECLKQLSQEILLLSHLSHPNIVQYYGSELDDDTLSVYLEYVSGGSIYKLLREYGPFSEPVIRSYAAQILSGLAYLHGRDTVHRDVKGANILVDPNGVVKLADFGMAKHISSHNSIHSFKGSPYWMAPEVIMTSNGYNLSVDIWSFGCTIIEMATSKPPWCQYEGVAAIFKIVNSKDVPEIPSHLSGEAREFLRLCLQRDPAARPTAVQLMDHPFVRDGHGSVRPDQPGSGAPAFILRWEPNPPGKPEKPVAPLANNGERPSHEEPKRPGQRQSQLIPAGLALLEPSEKLPAVQLELLTVTAAPVFPVGGGRRRRAGQRLGCGEKFR